MQCAHLAISAHVRGDLHPTDDPQDDPGISVPAGKQLLESDAIIKYLYNEYGDGKVPLSLSLGPLTTISCSLGQLPRVGKVWMLPLQPSPAPHAAHKWANPSRKTALTHDQSGSTIRPSACCKRALNPLAVQGKDPHLGAEFLPCFAVVTSCLNQTLSLTLLTVEVPTPFAGHELPTSEEA
jgi:hypothetical protein